MHGKFAPARIKRFSDKGGKQITKTITQQCCGTTAKREGNGSTKKNDATGLDNTRFRKNESKAGRRTSPDPYNGSASIGDPQSFNRYSYVQNDPTNFVDPSGLNLKHPYPGIGEFMVEVRISWFDRMWDEYWGADIGGPDDWGSGGNHAPPIDSGGGEGGGGGGGTVEAPQKGDEPCDNPRLLALARDVIAKWGKNTRHMFAPAFATRLSAALRGLNQMGIIPKINSDFRTTEDQVRMRNGGSGGNPAAKGVSLHQTGNAVDINGTWTSEFRTIRSVMASQGFVWGGMFKGRKDPPHFQINPYNSDASKSAAAASAEEYYKTRKASCFSS